MCTVLKNIAGNSMVKYRVTAAAEEIFGDFLVINLQKWRRGTRMKRMRMRMRMRTPFLGGSISA
jgi:hypothetical protein